MLLHRYSRELSIGILLALLVGVSPAAASDRDVGNLRGGAATVVDLPALSKYAEVVRGSSGGDINNDGIPDILLGQGGAFPDASGRGIVYVIFGQRPMPERIDVTDPAAEYGFVIRGPKEAAFAFEVAAGGDINGDGFDDVIVGASGADNNQRTNSGSAYVVFGKADHVPVDLALFDIGAQGMLGYRIDGAGVGGFAGNSVDGVGDMNSDGLADVLLAAPYMGTTYVVWGKRDPLPIDLYNLHREIPVEAGLGFYVRSKPAWYYLFYSAASAGDVNSDGIPDIVVAAEHCACVVFGKSDNQPVRLRWLGQRGFKIKGPSTSWAVSGAGDVNADGRADVIIGAPHVAWAHCCGKAYVVFGKASSRGVNLENLRRRGFAIIGTQSGQNFGGAVGGAGDVNRDGKADVIVGATGFRRTKDRRSAKGGAFVIYGKAGPRAVRTNQLDRRGFRMIGGRFGDSAGGSVDGIGDLNGDGKSDVVVGSQASQAYIVFGR